MARNILLDESKDTHWPLGFPWAGEKIRLQASLADIFDAARPATVGKGDFLLHSTLKAALITDIIEIAVVQAMLKATWFSFHPARFQRLARVAMRTYEDGITRQGHEIVTKRQPDTAE